MPACEKCGQDLPERYVESFAWWQKQGLAIGYTTSGGYVQIVETGDQVIAASPEFALEIAEALASCAREVLDRRKP